MVQGTWLSFHCWLLNQFCPWTNSNSIYQHYLAENLNVGYIAVNLAGQIRELIQVSNCSCLLVWLHIPELVWRAWTTHSLHVDPNLSTVTLAPRSTWRDRTSPSVPCGSQAALEGFWHLGRELLLCRTDSSLASPHPLHAHLCWWEWLWSSNCHKSAGSSVPHPLLFPQRCAGW